MQSTHKTLTSLSQTAMLHAGKGIHHYNYPLAIKSFTELPACTALLLDSFRFYNDMGSELESFQEMALVE